LIYSIVSLIGDSRMGWMCAVIGSSLFYALNHDYQGLAGAIGVVISCACFGILYLASKRNLWSNIIGHGLNDTIAFCAIYLGAFSQELKAAGYDAPAADLFPESMFSSAFLSLAG
jgi:membrane protease YdiL (CAAX protease family)